MNIKAVEISKLMRQRRKDLSLSQKDLSKVLGFSEKEGQYISNIERGLCQFPVKYIKKLSEALKVEEETIVEMMSLDYKTRVKEVLNETNTAGSPVL